MTDRAGLAEFLRRRRSALQPEDVGLPRGQRRRTSGLRREEAAALCHMSTDYYSRLERGPQPSEQMIAPVHRGETAAASGARSPRPQLPDACGPRAVPRSAGLHGRAGVAELREAAAALRHRDPAGPRSGADRPLAGPWSPAPGTRVPGPCPCLERRAGSRPERNDVQAVCASSSHGSARRGAGEPPSNVPIKESIYPSLTAKARNKSMGATEKTFSPGRARRRWGVQDANSAGTCRRV